MDNRKPKNPDRCPWYIIQYRDGTHPPHAVICHIYQVIYAEMSHGKRIKEYKVENRIDVRVPQTEITGNRKRGKIRPANELGKGELLCLTLLNLVKNLYCIAIDHDEKH